MLSGIITVPGCGVKHRSTAKDTDIDEDQIFEKQVNFELCPQVMPFELRLFRVTPTGYARSHVICKYIRVTQGTTRFTIK